jgi:O-methyltransferase/methyltransferase family protein
MPIVSRLSPPSAEEIEAGQRGLAVVQMLTGHWVAQIVRTAAELRVMDHVADGAQTADAVAGLEHSDPKATYRLMRACASLGLLATTGGGMFTVTPTGQLLRGGVPGSLREMALVQNAHGHWRSWELLPEAVRAGRHQVGAALGVDDMWGYFAQHPDEGALFAAAMSNMTGLVTEDIVRGLDLDGATSVLDVGGANGALVLRLMQAHPEITGQVFDLPHTADGARKAAADAGLAGRFTAVGGDFFADPLPTADYYLLKWVLHDWDDEKCVRLLRNVRAGAATGSRMLVVDAVVGEPGRPDAAALIDISMLVGTDGQERDLAELDALFAASGWTRVAATPITPPQFMIEVEAI